MPNLKYSPVIKYGIPPMREDSPEFKAFWDEEIRRCVEGYKPPDGVRIPGPYYRHLNHRKLSRRRHSFDPPGHGPKVVSFPLYRDIEHEVFDRLEKRRAQKKGGMIILKGRRKALSDDLMSYAEWEMTFSIGTHVSYSTPDTDQMEKVMQKFWTSMNNMHPQMSTQFTTENIDQKKQGQKVDTPFGARFVGSESVLYTSNIPKTSILKGEWMTFSVIDEIGTFKKVKLGGFWGDSVDCWKEGDVWLGFPVLVGTIDQVNFAQNTDVEQFWRNAEAYDLERFLIPADLAYGDYIDIETGISDLAAAKKVILRKREKLFALDDKTSYNKEVQNNPLTEDELFLLTMNSFVNVTRINECIIRVNNTPSLRERTKYGELVWEKTTQEFLNAVREKQSKSIYTGRVLFVEKAGGLWTMNALPINHVYPDADITAVDDYFKDKVESSDSLGGIITLRRFINQEEIYMIPTMTYLGRPETVALLHDEALKCAVFTKSRAAVEYHNPMFKDHFLNSKKVNGRDFLKIFPRVQGKIVNERDAYGYDMKGVLDASIERLKAWVDSPHIENCTDIRFLKNIAIFGKSNSDLGSAMAVALSVNDDMSAIPVHKNDEEMQRNTLMTTYQMRSDGIPVQHIHRNREEARGGMFNGKADWMHKIKSR